ncbi:MAG TPA: hypothetical protein PLU52_05440 [Opitutaceae bacterium]|nr:hypothetical protein [Opitutaceae bacterium]HND62340.1 hypothetical protein [Opitutaceae bacterium]
MKNLKMLTLVALVAGAFAGCASNPKPKDAKADNGEYEWVTPVGSNIAVKVRKGEKASTIGSPTETMTAEQLSTQVHTSGGAKPAGGP